MGYCPLFGVERCPLLGSLSTPVLSTTFSSTPVPSTVVSSTQHFYFYLLLFVTLLLNFDLPIKELHAFVEVFWGILQGTSTDII